MRGLRRNKQSIYYALYQGKEPILDFNGNKTGEYTNAYSEPVKIDMNIAAATGVADWNPFGIDTPYSKIAMTFDLNTPITETSKVWIDKDISQPANYVVTRVARSLNNICYALVEVENG